MRHLLALIALLALLTGCRPPEGPATASVGGASDGDVVVDVEAEGDAAVGRVPILVRVSEDGDGVADATVEVTGNMTHAGMTPVIVEAREVEPGLYRADDFEFTMAGDWILTADVQLPTGEELTAERPITVQ